MAEYMFQRAQELSKQIRQARQRLEKMTVEGNAGGMVSVYANGNREIVAFKISPKALEEADVEMLEDLLLAATRQAIEKAKELASKEFGKVAPVTYIEDVLGI